MIATLPLILAVRFACFWYFGLYRGVWPFASIYDLYSIIKAVGVSSLLELPPSNRTPLLLS